MGGWEVADAFGTRRRASNVSTTMRIRQHHGRLEAMVAMAGVVAAATVIVSLTLHRGDRALAAAHVQSPRDASLQTTATGVDARGSAAGVRSRGGATDVDPYGEFIPPVVKPGEPCPYAQRVSLAELTERLSVPARMPGSSVASREQSCWRMDLRK